MQTKQYDSYLCMDLEEWELVGKRISTMTALILYSQCRTPFVAASKIWQHLGCSMISRAMTGWMPTAKLEGFVPLIIVSPTCLPFQRTTCGAKEHLLFSSITRSIHAIWEPVWVVMVSIQADLNSSSLSHRELNLVDHSGRLWADCFKSYRT